MENTKNMTANDFIANCISMGITAMANGTNPQPPSMAQPHENPLEEDASFKECDISRIVREKYYEIVEKQVSEIAAFDPYYAEKYRQNAMNPCWHRQAFKADSVQKAFEQAISEWVQKLHSDDNVDFSSFMDRAKRTFECKHSAPCQTIAQKPSTDEAEQRSDTETASKNHKQKYPETFMPHIYVKFKECPRTIYYPSLNALYTSIVGEAHKDSSNRCPLHFLHDSSRVQAHDLNYQQRIDWLKKQVCKLVTKNMPNRTVEHIERITRYGIKYTA